jgi:hypothetical protein
LSLGFLVGKTLMLLFLSLLLSIHYYSCQLLDSHKLVSEFTISFEQLHLWYCLIINFDSELREIRDWLKLLGFTPQMNLSAMNDIIEILLKVALNTMLDVIQGWLVLWLVKLSTNFFHFNIK